MRRVPVLLTCLLLLAGACGNGGSEQRGPGEYGSGVDLEDDDHAAAAVEAPDPPATSSVAAPPESAPRAARRGPVVANQTVTDHPSGFRLTFVVADRLEFSGTDRIKFQLTFENTTSEPLYHDSNQELIFRLASVHPGGPAWDTTTCRASIGELDHEKPTTGILEVAPGESSSFVGVYPAEEYAEHSSVGPEPDSCRVPPGEYAATGVLDWCPPEGIARSEYNDQPYCDRTVTISARPIALTIR